MNRGDTTYLMLNYTINGEPLVENAYQEIELQICTQKARIQKKWSKNEILWGQLTYVEDNVEKTFTGYYVHLSQRETFALGTANSEVQLRILMNDEVGSSAVSSIQLGRVLSSEVLTDDNS